jgi:hypothetical protein
VFDNVCKRLVNRQLNREHGFWWHLALLCKLNHKGAHILQAREPSRQKDAAGTNVIKFFAIC